MAELTDEMQALVNESPACYLATSSEDGIPNVVPVGSARAIGKDKIVIAGVFTEKTLENIQDNPKGALTFNSEAPDPREASMENLSEVDAWQVKGSVSTHDEGEMFQKVKEQTGQILGEKAAEMLKCAIVMDVEEIYNLTPGPSAGEKIE